MSREYWCARCGQNPRYGDSFICDLCTALEATRVELRSVETLHPGDHPAQRALLIEVYDWRGFNRRIRKVGLRA